MHGGDLRDAGCDTDLVAILEQDYRRAPLDPALRALLDYAVKLTLLPASCGQADVDGLRAHAWTDAQISNAAMVAAYFNFINRVAEGLGVAHEPEIAHAPPLPAWRSLPDP